MNKLAAVVTAGLVSSPLLFAADTDGDGLADELETKIGTSITSKDTDGDGGSDYDEVKVKCDPNDSKHKIVKLGKWVYTNRKLGQTEKYREVVVSYDGKIVKRTDNRGPYSWQRIDGANSYVMLLKNRHMEKQMAENAAKYAKKSYDQRESYLARSPRYEQIKNMRVENFRLMRIYNANKTKYNLEAWNKVRIPMVKLQNKEYESVKASNPLITP